MIDILVASASIPLGVLTLSYIKEGVEFRDIPAILLLTVMGTAMISLGVAEIFKLLEV